MGESDRQRFQRLLPSLPRSIVVGVDYYANAVLAEPGQCSDHTRSGDENREQDRDQVTQRGVT